MARIIHVPFEPVRFYSKLELRTVAKSLDDALSRQPFEGRVLKWRVERKDDASITFHVTDDAQ